MVPTVSPRLSDSAESEVAEVIASIGFSPPVRTRYSSSWKLRPCAPATASVPKTIFSFGVLRPIWKTFSTFGPAACIAANPSSVYPGVPR